MTLLIHHSVAALHRTRGGAEWAEAGIFKTMAGFKGGLLADDARADDFFDLAKSVGDHPVAAQELNLFAALIDDLHSVRKKIVRLHGIGLLAHVGGLHFDLYVMGGGFKHSGAKMRELKACVKWGAWLA